MIRMLLMLCSMAYFLARLTSSCCSGVRVTKLACMELALRAPGPERRMPV